MLKSCCSDPSDPGCYFNPPALRVARQPLCPGTRLFPRAVLASVRSSNIPRHVLRTLEALEGLFRSPRSFAIANGPHEVQAVPPRLFTRCDLAGKSFEHPVDHSGAIAIRILSVTRHRRLRSPECVLGLVRGEKGFMSFQPGAQA